MAKDKKGFILYADQKEIFNQLTDEMAGKLIKHIFAYVNDENPISEDIIINLAFTPIKQQLKRDLVKFEETKEKRSEAGKAGANKRWQNIANDSKRISDIAKIADKDNVTDKVKDNVINIEERKLSFAESLKPFVEKYGREFIKDFYLYWTEETINKKKLKFETQKTFSIERRLSTWKLNSVKFGNEYSVDNKPKFNPYG